MNKSNLMPRALRAIAVLCACWTLQGSTCLPIQPVADQAEQAINNAIASLGSQSNQWQGTLQNLENTLIQQGQSTLANQVQTVINRGVAFASGEVRCDIAFLAAELSEALQDILARFKGQPPPAMPPRFCNIDPSAIDLRLPPQQRPATLNIYGFNFSTTNISVKVMNQNGSGGAPAAGIFTVPTEFMATFNVVNYPFNLSNTYLAFSLSSGEQRTVSIDQAPACGGTGQACCSVGTACVSGAGCLSNSCVTCPPPFLPKTLTVLTKSREFAGNNCGGQNITRTYGGLCDNGYHREQCSLRIDDACDVCTAQASWATSNPRDCTCNVHFNTPNDCFKGIHVDISASETQDTPPRPAGCP